MNALYLLLILCAPPSDAREAWLAARSGLAVTTVRTLDADPANYLSAAKLKPVYNYMLFSPPDAEPGEERWQEWQPQLSKEWGMRECKWLFHADLFPRHPDGGYDNSGWIDEEKLIPIVRKLPKGSLVCVNIEIGQYGKAYWDTLLPGGMKVNQEAIQNRIRLIEWLRQYNPHCQYGYYGGAALPRKSAGAVMVAFETWRRMLREMKPLAEVVDFLLPEIYPRVDWSEEFSCLYITRTIVGCRDYYPDKPIYPLVRMVFAATSPDQATDYTIETFRTRTLPPRYWRAVLEHAYMLGDGLMLWGGWRTPWDPGPWWRETEDFLIRRGVAPAKRLED